MDMGYVLFMFMYRAHIRAHMCAFLGTDSLRIWWEHTIGHHELHGLRTFHAHVPRACMLTTHALCLFNYLLAVSLQSCC
jgi:hypothetical protein